MELRASTPLVPTFFFAGQNLSSKCSIWLNKPAIYKGPGEPKSTKVGMPVLWWFLYEWWVDTSAFGEMSPRFSRSQMENTKDSLRGM